MFLGDFKKIVCIAKRFVKSRFVYQNEGYKPVEPSYEELVEERAKRNLKESAYNAESLLINGDTPENVKKYITEEITNIAAYERGEASEYPNTIRAINAAETQAKLTLAVSLRRLQSFKKIQLDLLTFNAQNMGKVDSVPLNISGFNTLLSMKAKLTDMQQGLANLAYPAHAAIPLQLDTEISIIPIDAKLRTIAEEVNQSILEGADKAHEIAKNILINGVNQRPDIAGLRGHRQLLSHVLPYVQGKYSAHTMKQTIKDLDLIIESELPKEPETQA